MSVLCIPVDRCFAGESILLDEQIDPSFLELTEKDELVPASPVHVCGTVYCTDEWIIANARVTASFRLPCSACNEIFTLQIEVPAFSHQEAVEGLKRGFWDVGPSLREAILVEVPFFVRCGGSACAHMDDIQKYFRDPEKEIDGHQPFRDL